MKIFAMCRKYTLILCGILIVTQNLAFCADKGLASDFSRISRGYPLKLIDATGQEVEFVSRPSRIISLNPSATTIISALNADQYLVGVTQFCPFPDMLSNKENIGTILGPDTEKIVSLRPDIVFATIEGNRQKTVSTLRNADIMVFVIDKVEGFDSLYSRIQKMGYILKRQGEAERLVLDMRGRISAIQTKLADKDPVKVFMQLGVNPIITINKDTIINQVIELGGAENIARHASTRYPVFSREAVLAGNPEVIIIVTMGPFAEEAARDWKRYKNIKAVQDNNIHILDSSIMCNIGPRLVEGIGIIARILHPDLFTGEE